MVSKQAFMENVQKLQYEREIEKITGQIEDTDDIYADFLKCRNLTGDDSQYDNEGNR